MSLWTDATTSSLSSASTGRTIRPSSAGGRASPLRVADSTSAQQSTNVDAPAVAVKRTVLTARKAGPSTRPVRSTSMS
ncbi:hypothetical protein ASG76_16400 [Nocardioides sp. Soil774]|nr:hypothetical protein ASG76_16400 [Nocardioides sp. Soil774]